MEVRREPDLLLLSRDETDVNAPVGPQEVQEAHQREGEILTITVNGKEINTTTEHPFWVKDRGWVEACDLRVGDELSTTDNRWIPIENIQRDGSITTVYNMTVKNWHTYFVGEPTWGFDVWVHNNHATFRGYDVPETVQRGGGFDHNLQRKGYTARVDTNRVRDAEGGFHIHLYQNGNEIAKITGRGGYVNHGGTGLKRPSEIPKAVRREVRALVDWVARRIQ